MSLTLQEQRALNWFEQADRVQAHEIAWMAQTNPLYDHVANWYLSCGEMPQQAYVSAYNYVYGDPPGDSNSSCGLMTAVAATSYMTAVIGCDAMTDGMCAMATFSAVTSAVAAISACFGTGGTNDVASVTHATHAT